MIPSNLGFLQSDFEQEEQSGKTYKMQLEGNTAQGLTDGIEAVKQAIFRILNTERYQYLIYSWNYGIETLDLYGQPITYVCPELERRIAEALLTDTRITEVTDFEHDTSTKGVIHTTFVVHTIYGDIKTEKEVNI
ncbi:MAG: DUF2634 domain-containing protein [Lachnospiraceae bacterium]|nr:DUF2634 domain-containing protein [Lachnospiraceae bacterium]